MALDRIHKEYKALQTKEVEGMVVSPKEEGEDAWFNWDITMEGPEDTPYEGGTFLLVVHFPSDYPFKPPRVQFTTKIFHPNINLNGGLCLDLLKERWSPVFTIGRVLEAVRQLVITPVLEGDPLEPEIAVMYTKDFDQFHRRAGEWVRKYATYY